MMKLMMMATTGLQMKANTANKIKKSITIGSFAHAEFHCGCMILMLWIMLMMSTIQLFNVKMPTTNFGIGIGIGIGSIIQGADAGWCWGQIPDDCKDQFYTCDVAITGLTCSADEWCAVTRTADYFTFNFKELLSSKGDIMNWGSVSTWSNSLWDSTPALNDPQFVADLRTLYYASACFRLDANMDQYGSVTFGNGAKDNGAGTNKRGSCSVSKPILASCDWNSRKYEYFGVRDHKQPSAAVLIRSSPTRSWVQRGTALIEDVLILARFTNSEAQAVCANVGGSLYRYHSSQQVNDFFNVVGPRYRNFDGTQQPPEFWVGLSKSKWTYDTSNYAETLSAPDRTKNFGFATRDSNNNNNPMFGGTDDNNKRYPFACTRSMVDMWGEPPARCYKGLQCMVRIKLGMAIAQHMTDSGDPVHVTVDAPFGTGFDLPVGATQTTIAFTPSFPGTISWQMRRDKGYRVRPQISFSQTIYDLVQVAVVGTAPTRMFVGQANRFTVNNPTAAEAAPSIVRGSTTSVAGTLSVGAFDTATRNAVVTFTPEAAAASATIALAVSGTCDCGENCNCFASPVTLTNITITAQDVMGLTTSSAALLGTAGSLTLTLMPPTTVLAGTTVGLSDTCGLRYSQSSVVFSAGETGPRQVTVQPPTAAVTAAVSCVIGRTITSSVPQYSGVAALTLVVAPLAQLQYTGLLTSMTTGTANAFTLSVSAVYGGQTITVAPTCGGASTSVSPASFDFTAASLSKEFTISAPGALSCTFSVAVSGTGAAQLNTAMLHPSVAFVSEKVTSTALTPLAYTGRVAELVVRCDVTGASVLTITGTWSGTAGAVNTTTVSALLTLSNKEARFDILALAVGTGSFTFSMNPAVTGYATAIGATPLEVRDPLVATVSPSALPARMSVGSFFATTLTFDILALPGTGHNVTITLQLPVGLFSVSPPQLVWRGSDPAYAPQSVTVTALGNVSTAAVNYTVAGTTPQFAYGTYNMSNVSAYHRATISPSVATLNVYGAGVDFTITVGLSGAPVDGPLVLAIAFPSAQISGATSVTVAANVTSVALTFRTLVAVEGSARFDVSLGIDTAATSSAVRDRFDPRISATSVLVLPYLPIVQRCNATEVYFGPNNAIVCNYTIASLPPAGTSIELTPRIVTSPVLASQAGTAAFGAPMLLEYTFTPVLAYAFVDGTIASFAVAVADSSKRFNPIDLTFSFTCRKLIAVTLSRIGSGSLYVTTAAQTNTFVLCVTLGGAPVGAAETVSVPVALVSATTNVSTLVFTSTSPLQQCFSANANAAGSQTVVLGVSGSTRFVAQTSALAVTVQPLEQVTLAVVQPTLFWNQSTVVSVAVGAGPGTSGTLGLAVAVLCNGAPAAGVADVAASISGITGSTSLDVRAIGVCLNASLRMTLVGTTTVYEIGTMVELRGLQFRPLKTATAALDAPVLYGGGADQRTLFVRVNELPFAAGSLVTATISAVPAGFVTLQFTSFDFLQTGSAISVNRSLSVTAVAVAVARNVTVSVAFSGSAIAEYQMAAPMSFTFELRPIERVAVTLDFTPAVIYVSPALTKTMRATLPVAPVSGSVVVVPVLARGSPTAVRFSPLSATLNASVMSVTFTVEALASTSSSEALGVTVTGDAIGYFPAPSPAEFAVTFRALGVVSLLEAPPSSLFETRTVTLYLQISYTPPSGFGDVVVAIAVNNSALSLGAAEVRWAAGETVLQKAFTITGAAVSTGTRLTLTMSAPPIYTAQLPAATVTVLSQRSILLSTPTFVYVGLSASCTVSIVRVPPGGGQLSLSVTPSDAVAVRVSSLFPFTGSSALTQAFTVEGVEARALPLQLSVTIFTGAADYDAPPARTLEVRALEIANVTGIAAGMYVGSTAVVTVTLPRAPQCSSGSISIVPVFGSTDALFSPAAGVTFAVGETTLSKSVTLTAQQVTGSAIPVAFPISGDCRTIYAAAAVPTTSVRIFSREVMTLSAWANATAADGVRFVYAGSRIPLTIDLGTPAMRHTGVVLSISFAGMSAAVAFSNTTVTFAPGVNQTTIWVSGLLETDAAAVTVVVVTGAHAFLPPTTPFRLRVLKRIPVSLEFAPATQLVVVDTNLIVSVNVESTALIGALTVSVSYGPELVATNVTFDPQTTILSRTITLRGAAPSAAKTLTVVLSGPGAAFYVLAVSNFTTAVYAQRYVEVGGGGIPAELFLGTPNARLIAVQLRSLPTLGASDTVTVTIASSPALTFSPSSFALSVATASVLVTLTGAEAGTADLRALMTISSTSNEYATRINNTVATVTVLPLLTATLGGYVATMYVNDTATFTVSIPRPPQSGSLVVTPRLVGSAYPLGIASPSHTFTTAGALSVTFTLTAGAATMPQTAFEVGASGSPEYASVAAATTLRVNPATQVAISGFVSTVYIGSTNAFTFTVSLARYPAAGANMTVSFGTASFYTMTPDTLRFGPGTGLLQTVKVQGRSPSPSAPAPALTVPVTLNDPTAFYEQPAALELRVLPLETYNGTLSSDIVYQGAAVTATLTFSKIPAAAVAVELLVLRSPSLEALDTAAYSVAPARSLTISGVDMVSFTLTALVAPETLLVTFRTTGAATSQFFILSLPEFSARFATLRAITATLPQKLYLGLATDVTVSVPAVPAVGSVRVSVAPPPGSGITFEPANAVFLSTTGTAVTMSVTATAIGAFAVGLSTQNTQTVAFMPTVTPATWNVQVEPPYPLDIVDPPAFVYAFAQNKLSIAVDYGTLLPGETITVSLTSNATGAAGLVIFPASLEVSTSQAVFQVHSTTPLYAMLNLTFTSNARRVVLSPRLAEGRVVLWFRPLKTIQLTLPSATQAVVGEPVAVGVIVSPAPSAGSSLFAELQYGGSPSNVALPPSLKWDATSPTTTRQLVFSGRSPTTAELVRVVFSNDPQYNLTTVSFSFRFASLWRVTPVVPLAVFEGSIAAVSFTLDYPATLGITMTLSILGVLGFYSNAAGTTVLSNNEVLFLGDVTSQSVYVVPAQVRATTITFSLGRDDAVKFAVPAPRTVTVETRNTVIVDASALRLIVYIAPTITVPVTVRIAETPTTGTLIVTPQLSCAAGQIVSFSPTSVFFNATQRSLSQTILLRGLTVSPACDVAFIVGGSATGFVGSSQRFTVETRALHTIDLVSPPTRVFLGEANRVALRVALDATVVMPLTSDVSVAFTPLSTCLTVSPSALFWAAGNMEDLTKIAFVRATCTGTQLGIRVTVTASNTFTNRLPATVLLNALPLQTVTVVDTASGSTDYFMYVGGAPLDLDVSIPEALDSTESLTVTAVYEGIAGSVNPAPAVWVPSPLASTKKKLLMQALSISPRAPIYFAVSGPPRFELRANGAGNLEVFGPKRVVAAVPTSLIVGQSVVVGVTIEDLPYPSETIVVTPTWEGQAGAVTWTPPQLQWTSNSVGREQFFQLTPHEFSESYNFIVGVSGSYRFVPTAYSGLLSIALPQRILSTTLPPELMKGQRYAVGVDVQVAPSAGQTLFVRLTPALSDQLVDCIVLDTTELAFTGEPGAATRRTVGVTVIRACSKRLITFKILGSDSKVVAQYDPEVTPREFETLEEGPVAVQWPSLLYVGPENGRDVVVTQRVIFYDEAEYLNLTIASSAAAGVVTFPSSLSWVYGTKAEKAFRLSSSAAGAVTFTFASVSSHLSAVVAAHVTTFLPLIDVKRFALTSEVYVGDANKLLLRFNVSDVPRILGNEPAPEFNLVATSSDGSAVVVEPSSLRWSADSPMEQFVFVRGVAPTTALQTVTFSVTGDGAHLVQAVPPPLLIRAVPLLLIHYDVAPSTLFVGLANRFTVNVTVPDSSSIRLLVSVDGEATAFTVLPTSLVFGPSTARWATFTVEGVYPTSRASFLRYTIVSAPPRIALRPMAATESMFVAPLVSVTREPADTSFTVFELQQFSVRVVPEPPGLQCVVSEVAVVSGLRGGGVFEMAAPRPLTATVTCTGTDPTYETLPPFVVKFIARRSITIAATMATYVDVQARLAVTVAAAPTSGKLIIEMGYNATAVTVAPPYLVFTPTSSNTQYFLVTGAALASATNLTFTFSGPTHEYLLPAAPYTTARVIDRLTVGYCVGAVCNAFSSESSSSTILGYVQAQNALRVQFRIPHATLFSDISIAGDTTGTSSGSGTTTAPLIFCATLNPCVPVTANTPLILTTTRALVTAYIFSTVALTAVPLKFVLRGTTDFGGPAAVQVGLLTLRPLERVVVEVSTLRRELFFGAQNSQTLTVRVTAPPLPGQNVEVIVTADDGLQLSTPLLTWSATSTGAMSQPLSQSILLTSTVTLSTKNRSVALQWRDRLSITSALNFEETFSASRYSFDLLPLVQFGVQIGDGSDARVLLPGRLEVLEAYLGEVNALTMRVTLDRLPVRDTDEVLVSIVASNPDYFRVSQAVLRFGQRVGGGTALSVRLWAVGMYDREGLNNTVTVRVSGPDEFKQDLYYIVRLRVNPLLVMQHDLVQTTIAVGGENAVTFRMWPPVPVDLTLTSLVTCGEVSFTAAEQLKWENNMLPKRLTVAGTLATTASSRCIVQTPVIAGTSASKFEVPPLSMQMWTRARPRVLAAPPDGIAGSDVRSSGIKFEVGLSEDGFWRWNASASSAAELLAAGSLRLRSTRDIGAEPNSVMALIERQLRGGMVPAFLVITPDTTRNVLKVTMGPHPDFYASARETISLQFTRLAMASGVTLDPLQDTVTFEIRGRKESLIGDGGNNVLGSGAASAAIAGGALSMGAATAAGKLQVIMNAFLCPNPDWRDLQDSVDWNEAPIPLRFGTNADLGVFVAVAFSNTIVIIGCLSLHLFVAYIVYRVRRGYAYRDKTYATARGVVRFPSLMLFPILFFYQSIISSSFKVIMYSPVMAFRFIGALTFLGVGFSVPGVVYAVVGPGFTAKYLWRDDDVAAVDEDAEDEAAIEDEDKGNKETRSEDNKLDERLQNNKDRPRKNAERSGAVRVFLYLFQPVGQWVHKDKLWLEAYGMFFDEFRGGYHWFVLVDVALTFLLGVIDGFEPASLTECYGRLSATVFLFFLQFISLVIYRPYSNRFLNGFFVFAYFLQFLSIVLVAAAVMDNTPQNDGVKVAVNSLLFFSALLMVKSILDLFRMLNDHFNFAAMFVVDRKHGYVLRDVLSKEEEEALGEELVRALKETQARRAAATNQRLAQLGLLGRTGGPGAKAAAGVTGDDEYSDDYSNTGGAVLSVPESPPRMLLSDTVTSDGSDDHHSSRKKNMNNKSNNIVVTAAQRARLAALGLGLRSPPANASNNPRPRATSHYSDADSEAMDYYEDGDDNSDIQGQERQERPQRPVSHSSDDGSEGDAVDLRVGRQWSPMHAAAAASSSLMKNSDEDDDVGDRRYAGSGYAYDDDDDDVGEMYGGGTRRRQQEPEREHPGAAAARAVLAKWVPAHSAYLQQQQHRTHTPLTKTAHGGGDGADRAGNTRQRQKKHNPKGEVDPDIL